jgi:hypothetical protein
MPSYVRSRTFCCCLPVRLGVFLLSLLAIAGGSFIAVFGWIQIFHLKQHPLGKIDQIALWIQCSLFTLLAVLAVFGFFGAIARNRAMISGFAIALAIHLGFSIASGAFSIYTMFARDSQAALDSCLQSANDSGSSDITAQTCKKGIILIKAVTVGVYVFTWLIQLYAYFIVERYVDQLDEERLADNAVVVVPGTMVMEAGGPRTTTYAAPAPYLFTDPRQGFGATRGPSNMA